MCPHPSGLAAVPLRPGPVVRWRLIGTSEETEMLEILQDVPPGIVAVRAGGTLTR